MVWTYTWFICRLEVLVEQQILHLLKLHKEYNWVHFEMPGIGQEVESPRFSIKGKIDYIYDENIFGIKI